MSKTLELSKTKAGQKIKKYLLLELKKIDNGEKTNILLPLPAVENIRRPSVKPNRRNTLALQGVTQVCCAESKISLRMCGLRLLSSSFFFTGGWHPTHVWSDASCSSCSLGFHSSWRRTILPPSGCKNFLLNINGLCLDNSLGFCRVKLRHNYVDLNRK